MQRIHHANIVLGQQNGYETTLKFLAEELNFSISQNPDFLLLENESFGIDDVRNLERWAITKPLLGQNKVVFLKTGSVSLEAQNALLKMLEEPKEGTYFFINLESLANILPTLLSRIQVIDLLKENSSEPQSKKIETKFLNDSLADRLKTVRNLVKKDDKQEIKNLINDLEKVAYQNQKSEAVLKNILLAKVFASARGGSPKMLLEWLACVL